MTEPDLETLPDLRQLQNFMHLFTEMFETHIANHPAAMHHFNLTAEGHKLLEDLQVFLTSIEELGTDHE